MSLVNLSRRYSNPHPVWVLVELVYRPRGRIDGVNENVRNILTFLVEYGYIELEFEFSYGESNYRSSVTNRGLNLFHAPQTVVFREVYGEENNLGWVVTRSTLDSDAGYTVALVPPSP